MSLAQELRDQIRAYVDGRASFYDLRVWLAAHVQAVYDDADTSDQGVSTLSDRAWILMSEVDYGHWQESDLRAALDEFVPAVDGPPRQTSTASSAGA